jgi:hypothetical protein
MVWMPPGSASPSPESLRSKKHHRTSTCSQAPRIRGWLDQLIGSSSHLASHCDPGDFVALARSFTLDHRDDRYLFPEMGIETLRRVMLTHTGP